MKRSAWKLPFVHSVFFKKFKLKKRSHLIFLRNSKIPASLVGRSVKIHNGAKFWSKVIYRNMIGWAFGQFSYTKRSDRQLRAKRNKKKK